jgi:hypothetical protein
MCSDWTYVVHPTLELYRMPWPTLIKNVRTALTVVKNQALDAERRSFTSNVAHKQGKQSKFNYPIPVTQLGGTQRNPPARVPVANNLKDLLRQSLPPELLQDSEDALDELITVASKVKLQPDVGKVGASSSQLIDLVVDRRGKGANSAASLSQTTLSLSTPAGTLDKPVKRRTQERSSVGASLMGDRPGDSRLTSGSLAGRVARTSQSRYLNSEHPEAPTADESSKWQPTVSGEPSTPSSKAPRNPRSDQTSYREKRTRMQQSWDVSGDETPKGIASDAPRNVSDGGIRGLASDDWKSIMRDLNKDIASELSKDDKGPVHGVSICSLLATDASLSYVLLY